MKTACLGPILVLALTSPLWGEPGSAESVTPARAEFEEICRQVRASFDPYYGRAQLAVLEQQLSRPDLPPEQRVDALRELGEQLLRLGDERAGFEELNRALQLAAQGGLPKRRQIHLLSRVGLAALRIGEVENCVGHHAPGMCLLPIGPDGRHRERQGSELAMRAFLGVLSGMPEHPLAPWLLNIAAMTLGQYPDGVPPAHRLPMDRLRSPYDIGRFTNVAGELGLHIHDVAGGAIVDDFTGDGRLDVVTSSAEPCTPLRLFVQQNAGGGVFFVDRGEGSGLDQQLGAINLVQADYDDDGDLDLFVLRGGWMGPEGLIRNSLMQNDGTGRFVDVTRAVGLAEPARPTQTAGWADYDLDGDLDLFIGNEGESPEVEDFASNLFRQDRDAEGKIRFVDVAGEAGVTNQRYAKSVAWGDVDGDGDVDLYVSNFGPNRLYLNGGDGTFEDVATRVGVAEPVGQSFGAFFFDLENDGDLDLFVSSYEIGPEEIAAYFFRGETGESRPRLYRNRGDGTFEEVGRAFGLVQPLAPMGHNFGDLDNDGFLDIYLGTGWPPYEALMPNIMLRNDGGRRFQDVTYSGGFGHLQKGHGVAFADIDDDGDQDVFEQMGGAFPGDAYPSSLYRNPGHGHGWLTLSLEGDATSRSAFGARVHARVRGPAGPGSVYVTIGAGGSFGGSPLRAELGLGDAQAIESVEIFWPVPGETQRLDGLEIGGRYTVRQGQPARRQP